MALLHAATKLPKPLLDAVRKHAHLESLRTGNEITASALIREAVEQFIVRVEARP